MSDAKLPQAPTFTPDEAALIRAAIQNIGFQTSVTAPDFEKVTAAMTESRKLWLSIDTKLNALTAADLNAR